MGFGLGKEKNKYKKEMKIREWAGPRLR